MHVRQVLTQQLGVDQIAPDYCEACGLPSPQVRQRADLRGRWTEFTVQRCLGCGLGRTEPRPGDPYLEAATREIEQQDFDRLVEEELARTSMGSPWSREFGRALVAQGVPQPVMDLGCGEGHLLEVLAAAGMNCEGVELRPLCAAVSRRRAGVPVATGTIETFLARPHHVGTIVLSHVLEHLPAPVETLRALAHHADAIAVAVPNSLSVRALMEWSLKPGGFAYAPGEHLWQMTPAAVRGIFERAGLRVSYLECHANAPSRGSLRSMLRRRAAERAGGPGDTSTLQEAPAGTTEPGAQRSGWLPRTAARAADRALFEVERHLQLPWVGEQVIAIGRSKGAAKSCVVATRDRVSPSSVIKPKDQRRLVVLKTSSNEVWDYTLLALERNLERMGVAQLDGRRLGANGLLARGSIRFGLLRNYCRLPGLVFFKAMMTPAAWRLFPTELFFETVLYCLDCFPPVYDEWERLFRRVRPRILFMSSRQAAAHFHARLAETETVWLPEATDPMEYQHRLPLVQRQIDVLELGRRHRGYHDQITSALATAGKAHRYERQPGQIIFPTKEDLVEGMGQTKVSVCFPSSMTHPARSGDGETATHRYFESIASRSVLVGHCPAELRDLFGYDPVVPVDWSDPVKQLLGIVDRIEEYQPHVERNHQRLLEVGTWEVRARGMMELLRDRGIV